MAQLVSGAWPPPVTVAGQVGSCKTTANPFPRVLVKDPRESAEMQELCDNPHPEPFCCGKKQFGHDLGTGVLRGDTGPQEREAPSVPLRSGVHSRGAPHAQPGLLWGAHRGQCAQLPGPLGSAPENKRTLSPGQQPEPPPASGPPFREHTSLERHQRGSVLGPSLCFCRWSRPFVFLLRGLVFFFF